MKRKSSGITLIALVVTIIVLLILAGISIMMLSGNNGILNRAGEAKKRTDEEQIIEEARMDILSTQATKLTDALTEAELEGILEPKYGTLSTEEERTIDKILTTTDGKYEIPVSKIYDGILIESPTPKIGDFVNYELSYKDMDTDYLFGENKPDAWRILDYNSKSNTVKIISTGVPARLLYRYDQNANNGWWGTTEEVNKEYNQNYSDWCSQSDGNTYYHTTAYVAYGLRYNFKDIQFNFGEYAKDFNKGSFKMIGNVNEGNISGNNFLLKEKYKNIDVNVLSLEELNNARSQPLNSRLSINPKFMGGIDGAVGLFYLGGLENINQSFGYVDQDYSGTYYTLDYSYILATPYSGAGEYILYPIEKGIFTITNYLQIGIRPVVTISNIKLEIGESKNYWTIKQID